MDQTALTRALLLLLFLHLSPPGGHSHPLGGPDLDLELPGLQDTVSEVQTEPVILEPVQQGRSPVEAGEAQEVTVSEVQTEPVILEPLQQGHGPVEAGEAQEVSPMGVPQPQIPEAQGRLPSPKTMSDSGCFGGKMDRIGFHSRLRCNVLGSP
ncbi:natriuretic peptides B [Loxodonta africana]|uniref:natriuretic peptides B n=1 Tax=Loxodonta africana TaxID=9785 RepID=UPI0002234ECB